MRPLSKPARIGIQVALIALVLAPLLWALLHVARGGTELPEPIWTEADLVPLPLAEDNAWFAMGPTDQMPDFTITPALRDSAVPIEDDDRQAVEAELARPEVQALLASVPEVLARPHLIPPDELDLESVDSLRMVQWRNIVGFSINSTLDRDPQGAAQALAKLFPMWVGCANAARSALAYLVCASDAQHDLDLMIRVARRLSELGDIRTLELLKNVIRQTSAMSSDHVMRAEYIVQYRALESLLFNPIPVEVDLEATSKLFNQFFDPEVVADEAQWAELCASTTNLTKLRIYEYNFLGKLHALVTAGSICVSRRHLDEVTRAVSVRREKLLVQPD